MPTGPDPADFQGPTNIFSGHFHKRQEAYNVRYIGNTFPMDFSDAGDENRGMAIFDVVNDQTTYINWSECPRYTKTCLSSVLDDTVEIHPHSRIRCIVDIPISFEEGTYLRQKFMEDFQLREFVFEESREIAQALSGTETTVDINDKLATVDELVVQMLNDINVDRLDNNLLMEIYKQIQV
jgi:DNA repair exonuclease SbcCD nuclease subunit